MLYLFLLKVILFLLFFSIFAILYVSSYLKKVIFLNIMQSMLILLYVFLTYPISLTKKIILDSFIVDKFDNSSMIYADSLPQALMLTAIIVGFITSMIAISLIFRIKKSSVK